MNIQSKLNYQSIHQKSLNCDKNLLSSNKITMHYPKKLRTQCIQFTQNYEAQNNESKYNNYPPTQYVQVQIKKKFRFINPLKHTYKQHQYAVNKLKLERENIKNYTTNEKKKNELGNDQKFQRNFGTAPHRKRIKSQSNKENIHNQEEKNEQKEENKQQNSQCISSLFHYSSKSKLAKISNFMKYRAKPTMIFCSSKLPKDFFGDSVQTPLKCHPILFPIKAMNKNLQLQNSIKKLKYSSSTKTLEKSQPIDNVQLLKLGSSNADNDLLQKSEPAFTFRKDANKTISKIPKKSQKSIQITPFFSHKYSQTLGYQLPSLKQPQIQSSQPNYKSFNRNFSKLSLKL